MEQDPSLSVNEAVKRIGERVGVNPDTLRGWIKQTDIDAGRRRGTTTAEAAEIRRCEAEVRELKRANEILLAASSFFARELDPRLPCSDRSSKRSGNDSGSSRSAGCSASTTVRSPRRRTTRQQPGHRHHAWSTTSGARRDRITRRGRLTGRKGVARAVRRARKMYHQLRRGGVERIPRCQVERLMRRDGYAVHAVAGGC